MTCQHCQTWILDDDHRCSRCGRRVRATPSRISPSTYPIAASATAPAYDFAVEPSAPPQPPASQQALFAAVSNTSRVIPFDSLTSAAERDAIRLRAAGARPAAVKSTRVESKPARGRRSDPADQRALEFSAEEQMLGGKLQEMSCEAPVATAGARMQAALFDAILMACGFGPGLALFFYQGGLFSFDRHVLPFLAAALLTIPLFYKLLWAFAGKDTPGMRIAGLELIDFDGKRPSKDRRFARLFGSFLSLLAAGIGMIWTLVDEERLTWHDHMSGTFPTFSSES
jgi:uncharacterized RDD family membrane protein YckC